MLYCRNEVAKRFEGFVELFVVARRAARRHFAHMVDGDAMLVMILCDSVKVQSRCNGDVRK